jgi:hypothetical protein
MGRLRSNETLGLLKKKIENREFHTPTYSSVWVSKLVSHILGTTQIKHLQRVSTKILKARNTGNNKKLDKVKKNEIKRQVVCQENTHTNIYILWTQKLAKITRRGISYKHTKYIQYAKCTELLQCKISHTIPQSF